MPFFFSIQLLCFPESLYIISSTDQSLFGFFFTNIENYSELLGSYFYRLILKKNPKTIQQTHFVSFMLLEQKSTVCWSDTDSLFYHHLLYKVEEYVAIFIHTTPLCTSKNCHTQAAGQSLISGASLKHCISALPSSYFAPSSERFSIDFPFSLIFKSVSALYIFPSPTVLIKGML